MTIEALGKIAALFGAFAWLAYWAGRWYKEWFFAQFGIPYEVLGFPPSYYFFGSWATIATAVSALCLLFTFVLVTRAHLWLYSCVSGALLGCAILLQFWAPDFSPDAPVWKKVLGSRDLAIVGAGVLAAAVLALAWSSSDRAQRIVRETSDAVASTGFIGIIASLLLGWAVLAVAGYAVGTYHGNAAICCGKMGTRWVRFEDSWWVFVVRADRDRNFIYDRSGGRTKVASDADLSEWGGPVTREER